MRKQRLIFSSQINSSNGRRFGSVVVSILLLIVANVVSCRPVEFTSLPKSAEKNAGSSVKKLLPQKEEAPSTQPAIKEMPQKDMSLFDGTSLSGWQITKFGGEGEVFVKDGQMILEMGADLTGVTYHGEIPTSNYEVTFDAMRMLGSDFFCGLTFPVKQEPCTLILGGWGGGLCGLSSIGDYDASENETRSYQKFTNNRWYQVRLRVSDSKIEAWIDDEQIIDHTIDSRKFSIRIEVELSKPFGFATWQTSAALRNIRLRKLSSETADAASATDSQ